ncbi:MAG: indoleacetamide hydrolase [Gammaproteobacteria bacterium]|nr:indoleacetamide hydrolase [Gammaproteobacteria bacterium]
MQLADDTVTHIAATLAAGGARSADLVEIYIARTAQAAALNCYVGFDADALRAQARAADQRLAAGERLPLLGVPLAVKENVACAGLPCGAGTAALAGRVATADAPIIARLRAAGALITGTLGMHELAFGITSNNAVTGAVRNPWDPSRIPGGSSGGSGAVVAARLVPAAIGTDTGGSVRIPAALCGVAGFRPSVGRLDSAGIAPIALTRDTAGPLAHDVADLALLDAVMSGDDAPLPELEVSELRLGVPVEHFWEDLAPGVRACADAALARLADAGVELVPVALPGLAALSEKLSFVIATYEFARDFAAWLARHHTDLTLPAVVERIASPDVRAALVPLLSGGLPSAETYAQALRDRTALQAQYAAAFANYEVDALLFPTTPATAARIGEDRVFLHNGREIPTFPCFIRNTDPGSNAGLPGLSLPIGRGEDGLPVGLALDGPAGGDRRLLAVGCAIEQALPPMPFAPLGG